MTAPFLGGFVPSFSLYGMSAEETKGMELRQLTNSTSLHLEPGSGDLLRTYSTPGTGLMG